MSSFLRQKISYALRRMRNAEGIKPEACWGWKGKSSREQESVLRFNVCRNAIGEGILPTAAGVGREIENWSSSFSTHFYIYFLSLLSLSPGRNTIFRFTIPSLFCCCCQDSSSFFPAAEKCLVSPWYFSPFLIYEIWAMADRGSALRDFPHFVVYNSPATRGSISDLRGR